MFQREDADHMTDSATQPVEQVRTEPVRLKWSEKNCTVLIEGQDEDRFALTVQQVIQACNIQQAKEGFEAQFADLKNLLGGWVHRNRSDIHKAFITVLDARILFLVITQQVDYNPDFDDALTDLDLMIAQTPFVSNIPLSVQSLPRCEDFDYNGFLDPLLLLEYDPT